MCASLQITQHILSDGSVRSFYSVDALFKLIFHIKVSPKDGICTSADHDEYQRTESYQVLINPRQLKLQWTKPGNSSFNFVPPNAVIALPNTQQYIARVQKLFEDEHVIGKVFPKPAQRYLEDLDYFTALKGSLEFLTVLKV